jgi:hypothetical protein
LGCEHCALEVDEVFGEWLVIGHGPSIRASAGQAATGSPSSSPSRRRASSRWLTAVR